MHRNLMTPVMHDDGERAICDALVDRLGCYLIGNECMFEDEDCTDDMAIEWASYARDFPEVLGRCPTWQDYVRTCLHDDARIDVRIETDDEGNDHAIRRTNPQGLMDDWQEWHASDAETFPDGSPRVSLPDLVQHLRDGSWDMSDYVDTVVLDASWHVADDYRHAVEELAHFADAAACPDDYDVIIVDYHV